MNGDFLDCYWEEDGFHLKVWLDENPDGDGTADLRLADRVEFYRAVRLSCDSWIAEMEAARASMPSRYVEDPADVEPFKRDGGEWMREQADLMRKTGKENPR